MNNMLSLHNITHAVMLAIIATLIRKYLLLKFHCEDLELALQFCESSSVEVPDKSLQDTTASDSCVNNLNLQYHLKQMADSTDKPSGSLVNKHINLIHQRTDDILSSVDNKYVNQMEHRTDEPSSSVQDEDAHYSLVSSNMLSSSVWCYGNNRSDKICHFHNLCYYSSYKDFVFVHGTDSLVEGLHEGNVNILDLSSVDGHNKFSFSFVDVLSEKFQNVTVQWVNETSLIFSRFKPDNLMHVLHDDILPLHHTVRWVSFMSGQVVSSLDVQLVFMDDWGESEFDSMYEALTDLAPVHKLDLDNSDQLVCFSDSFVGISKATTWYQYGFLEPQGPKPHTEVTSKHIHDAVQHLLAHLPSEVNTGHSGQYLVLLSRKQNRLILNEADLMAALVLECQMKVVSVSFETHTISDMMHITRASRGVIGVHGSLMSLSLFLKPGSVVIEVFPFAVNPLNYTPYKSLATIKGMHFVYKAWVNVKKENTISHPEYLPEFGGIFHLPDSEQDLIKSQTEVPQHLCCSDPSWLFHIYQDTIVSVPEITALVKTALEEASNINNSTLSVVDKSSPSPGPVSRVSCERIVSEVGLTLQLKWEQPWNIPYLEFVSLNYEVWLQNVSKDEDIVSFLLSNKTMHILSRSVGPSFKYHVWVRCVIDKHITGQFNSVLDC